MKAAPYPEIAEWRPSARSLRPEAEEAIRRFREMAAHADDPEACRLIAPHVPDPRRYLLRMGEFAGHLEQILPVLATALDRAAKVHRTRMRTRRRAARRADARYREWVAMGSRLIAEVVPELRVVAPNLAAFIERHARRLDLEDESVPVTLPRADRAVPVNAGLRSRIRARRGA